MGNSYSLSDEEILYELDYGPHIYEIKISDTSESIANKLGLSLDYLALLNPDVDFENISFYYKLIY